MKTETETRENRHLGKRLAAINALLDSHLKDCPRPVFGPPILHIVTAFGLDFRFNECGSPTQHEQAWASLDATGEARDREHDYRESSRATPKTYPREEVLWRHVAPLLRGRLKFRVSADLLPEWKQAEMKRIAALTGFHYESVWETICTITLPPPASWGKDIDPMTLEPTTLGAQLKRNLKASAKATAAAAKKPVRRY